MVATMKFIFVISVTVVFIVGAVRFVAFCWHECRKDKGTGRITSQTIPVEYRYRDSLAWERVHNPAKAGRSLRVRQALREMGE
jgi:hypothetical protein